MREISGLVRDNVKRLKPFSSARAEYKGDADIFLDANENPFDSPHNRYPDPYHKELRSHISEWRDVSADHILLGNGSDEVIDFIIRAFCEPRQDIVRMISPTFGMYEVSADVNDVAREEVLLTADFDLDVESCLADQTDQHKVLFLCSPNNPTGNNLDRDKVIQVIEGWNGIVVVDEAYIDFSEQASFVGELVNYKRLIVLQTFSKALGAAGLRIGMCFANPEIIGFLKKIKPPYNIGVQTQLAAIELLKNIDSFNSQIEVLKNERGRVAIALQHCNGILKQYPSHSNFILLKCKDHSELKNHLQSMGVIIRDRSKLVNCEACLRFTIGKPEENDMLIKETIIFYNSNHK